MENYQEITKLNEVDNLKMKIENLKEIKKRQKEENKILHIFITFFMLTYIFGMFWGLIFYCLILFVCKKKEIPPEYFSKKILENF